MIISCRCLSPNQENSTQITNCQLTSLFSNFAGESDLRCPDRTNANRDQLLQSSRQHGAFLPRSCCGFVDESSPHSWAKLPQGCQDLKASKDGCQIMATIPHPNFMVKTCNLLKHPDTLKRLRLMFRAESDLNHHLQPGHRRMKP